MQPKPGRKFIERIQMTPHPLLGLKLPRRAKDRTILKTIKRNKRLLKRSFNWDPDLPSVLNGPRSRSRKIKSIRDNKRDPNYRDMLTSHDLQSLGFYVYFHGSDHELKKNAMMSWLVDCGADHYINDFRWIAINDPQVAMLFKLTFG